MKSAWYLAASAALGVAVASPHPAYPDQQQPLGGLWATPSSASAEPAAAPAETLSVDGSHDVDKIIDASPLLSFHRDLVQIESISGNEHDVGVFLAQFLEARNFTVVKQEVPPVKEKDTDISTINTGTNASTAKPRYNIYAYPSSLTTPPSILLTSHIDTVPPFIPYSVHETETEQRPNTNTADTSINLDNLVLAGRGTVDAKGSVAAQVFAALETLHAHPSAALGLLFVVGEEIGGDGMKVFSSSPLNPAGGDNGDGDGDRTCHTVIFGEPTNLALVSGHKGMLGFEVIAHGKAAHSGYPWLGRSAVSGILPALARVDTLGNPHVPHSLPFSWKYGPTTLNIGIVRAGVATNVVPASARADVSVRLAGGTPDEAREIIRAAVAEATRNVDADVFVDFEGHSESYPPQDLDADVEGFEVTTVNYGTDVPSLRVRPGVKRYLYGPGSIFVAHGDREALTVRHIQGAVGGYRKLVDAALMRERSGDV